MTFVLKESHLWKKSKGGKVGESFVTSPNLDRAKLILFYLRHLQKKAA